MNFFRFFMNFGSSGALMYTKVRSHTCTYVHQSQVLSYARDKDSRRPKRRLQDRDRDAATSL
jgi:hypothetical protein